jgi:D-glycero-D-manno-heptose 1,7-bisphosphate phosphatase
LIEDCGYISVPELVELLPGASALVAAANRAGVPVVVVTNQSGIDRGLFGWKEFAAVQNRMDALLAEDSAHIDAVAACPFHPEFTPGYDAEQAQWRKPNAAMLTALTALMNLDPGRSWLVGDSARDVTAACRGGLAGAVQLTTNEERMESGLDAFRVEIAHDTSAARATLGKVGLLDAE